MFSLVFTQGLVIAALVLVALGTLSLLGLLYSDHKNDQIW